VETLFQDPNPQQQRAIQDWAHSVAYDYEYTLATRTARVVKPCETVPVTAAETNATDLFDFDSYPMPEEGEIDLGGTNEDPRIPDVSLSDDITQWFDRQDQSFWSTHYQAPLETEDDCVGHSRPKDMTELPIVRQVAPSTPQESISDPIQGKQNKNARPLSPSNSHIGRARKMLGRLNGRRQSVHSQASSGYQEVVFDSGSSRPSTPGTPGRRGPLDAAARAAIKAVKAVKACWRCKFLRKPVSFTWKHFMVDAKSAQCSEDNPCLRCPTKSANCKEKSWPAVGCNRGSFKEVLPPLQLCPSSDATQDRTFHDTTLPYCMQVKLNEEYQSQLSARAEVLQEALVVSTEREPTTLISYIRSLEKTDVDYNFEEFIQFSSSLPMAPSMRVAFTPLEECIAAVVYEATCCNTSILMRVDGSPQALSRIVKMLYSAARHQANIDSVCPATLLNDYKTPQYKLICFQDELVAQSIICLRSSFEAARITRNPLWLNAHKLCKTDICQVDSIKTLNEHLGLYLDALSKVFFKKENMKNKETWWLSTFYSFAIQGIVRELIRELSPTPESQAATDRYLHLALRLFIASSGNYDPLMRDYTSSGKGKETSLSYISDLEEAKTAMEQSSWASKRISSSADYLRKLFEDDGRHEMTENDPASISSFPSELLPSDDEPGEDDGGRWDEEASLEEKKTSRARRRILTPRSPLHVREPKVSSANELSMLDQRSPPPWSSSIRAYSGSRPYRPSSLSSMESASDLGAIPTSLLPEHIKIPQVSSSISSPENYQAMFSNLPPPSPGNPQYLT